MCGRGGVTAGALANVAPLDQQRAVEYFGGAAGGASGSLPRPFGLPPCAVVSLSLVALLRALSLPLHSGLVCGLAELGWMHVWFADAIEEEPALRLTERLPWLVPDSGLGVGRDGLGDVPGATASAAENRTASCREGWLCAHKGTRAAPEVWRRGAPFDPRALAP